jgi:ParB-like chromosome segregation protein Spo0J
METIEATTHALAIGEVACDSIRVSDRHRRDMGDLESLAVSIATEGLLQPIGITEDNVLVFGERRLLAVRDILKRATIAARVVQVSSIAAGEYAENEIRKDFTSSERVAIGKALEETLGERRGRNNRQNSDELKGQRSDDIAAERAGFGSRASYEDAKKVVEHGTPELVAAMDTGDVSIHAVSVIATQPAERQAEIVQTPRELRRQIVREIREAIDLPTTTEARRLARETGHLVADRTGRYRSGASAEERAATKADLDAIWDVTRGVLAVAGTKLDPKELARRLEYWHCPDIRAKTPVALAWLAKFEMELKNNDQIS